MQLFLLPWRCVLSYQLSSKWTPFHIMSLSQNAIVFSVNGTQQNKRIKDASLLVLKAEYAYCIHFILQGKCVNFIQSENGFHYLSGCFFVLNNHPSYLLKQFWHILITLVIFGSQYTTLERHHQCCNVTVQTCCHYERKSGEKGLNSQNTLK